MTNVSIPSSRQPFINPDGTVTKEFYRFLSRLAAASGTGAVAGITVGSSPFVYTAQGDGHVILDGGTVSKTEFSRDGSTYYVIGPTSGMFPLSQGDSLRVTYSGLPTMTFVPGSA